MLIAFFSDIHANRQAFEACLAQARERGAERIVLFGDYVGYGADPEWTVTTVMDLVDKGAMAVLGNHDNAVGDPARISTSRRRSPSSGPAASSGVPSGGSSPRCRSRWRRPIASTSTPMRAGPGAGSTWRASRTRRAASPRRRHASFCGHIHRPALYSMSLTGKMTAFTPTSGVAVQLLPGRRWLAVLGSVGQPRDGNPAACYVMLDTARREVTCCRVPYDVEAAAARIREKGLPPWLAERLSIGR